MRIVNYLKVSRRSEIKHLGDSIIACIQFDQVLDVAQMLQTCQLIIRNINVLQIFVVAHSLLYKKTFTLR